MLRSISDSLLSIIYPQQCNVCGGIVDERDDGVACRGCWERTRFFTPADSLCPKCGDLLSDRPTRIAQSCLHCTGHLYDSARALGVYEKAIAAVILDMKKRPVMPRRIKHLLLEEFRRLSPAPTLIIPVPLSRRRSLERGFNQAELIASFLSKQSGVPAAKGVLIRPTHTRMHRAAMDRKGRERTVRKAFELADASAVSGMKVLLVDDVLTSGSTASACAGLMVNAGAEWIKVLTIGRAVLGR
jgi:ComF family protein